MCGRHVTLDGKALAEALDRAAHTDPSPTRRTLLTALVASTALTASGCVVTPSGDRALILVSPAQERELGLQAWDQIRQEERRSGSSRLRRRLSQVGENILVAVGENPRQWEFEVFQGDQKNAFALPGNKVGFYEGIFESMDNDAQLATVVGHEIGHNRARHAARRLSNQVVAQFGMQMVAAGLEAGSVAGANAIMGALGLGTQVGVFLPFSREHELQADRLGLNYMALAGYDPDESIRFWQNMQSASRGGRPPEFLSTHPAGATRIAQLQQLLPEAQAVYRQRVG